MVSLHSQYACEMDGMSEYFSTPVAKKFISLSANKAFEVTFLVNTQNALKTINMYEKMILKFQLNSSTKKFHRCKIFHV